MESFGVDGHQENFWIVKKDSVLQRRIQVKDQVILGTINLPFDDGSLTFSEIKILYKIVPLYLNFSIGKRRLEYYFFSRKGPFFETVVEFLDPRAGIGLTHAVNPNLIGLTYNAGLFLPCVPLSQVIDYLR